MEHPPFERLPPDPAFAPRYPEAWLGEVVSVQDPDGLGRVQVRLYQADGPADHDAPVWARVAVAIAGASRGSFLIPDVGDEVLITFVGGDPSRPVVIGSLWNGRDQPTETLSGDEVNKWTFTSKDGTKITIDEESQPTVKVETPGGVTAEFTDTGGGKIEMVCGGNTVTMDSSGVSVQSSGQVKVQASTIDVTAGNINVSAAMTNFSGVVKCTTLIATTVVGTTYTPGAGNIW